MTKQIASIYFSAVHAERKLYSGVYDIPAVEFGAAPFILTVTDKRQRSQEPSPDGKNKITRVDLIDGKEIALDILREWCEAGEGMAPQCRPGMWLVRDEIPVYIEDGPQKGLPEVDADGRPVWRQATEREKSEMFKEDFQAAKQAQAAFADYKIRNADSLEQKAWKFIDPAARVAARYYGRDREWLAELRDGDVKSCGFCVKKIPAASLVCMYCQNVVDPAGYNRKKQEIEGASGTRKTA